MFGIPLVDLSRWILSCGMSFVVFLLKNLFEFKEGFGALEKVFLRDRKWQFGFISIELFLRSEVAGS